MNEEIQTPISCHKESDYLISSSDYENANNKYTSITHVWDNGPTPHRRAIPWRGLVMAVLLIIFGGLFILGGISIILGLIKFENLDSFTPYAVMVVGLICLVPGAYHIIVACCACHA